MTRRVLIYGDSNSYGTMPMAGFGDTGVFPKDVRWGVGEQYHQIGLSTQRSAHLCAPEGRACLNYNVSIDEKHV